MKDNLLIPSIQYLKRIFKAQAKAHMYVMKKFHQADTHTHTRTHPCVYRANRVTKQRLNAKQQQKLQPSEADNVGCQ
jgi:hypothetical protein